MAIEEELSSDIAIALLAGGERDPERLKKLKDVVLMIDTSLRQIAAGPKRVSFGVRRPVAAFASIPATQVSTPTTQAKIKR